jgi:hypothetical protein
LVQKIEAKDYDYDEDGLENLKIRAWKNDQDKKM